MHRIQGQIAKELGIRYPYQGIAATEPSSADSIALPRRPHAPRVFLGVQLSTGLFLLRTSAGLRRRQPPSDASPIRDRVGRSLGERKLDPEAGN